MINYIIQVLLFQTLFLAVYDFFLQKETFFKWNRIYLITTPLLSFLIPLVKFESIQKSIPKEYVEQLPTVFLNPEAIIENTTTAGLFFTYLNLVFIAGVVIFTLLFIYRLFQIFMLVKSNKTVKKGFYKLVWLTQKQAAFSFFNYIFISLNYSSKKETDIIQHEIIHCKQKHSIDLLFFEILKIVMWFNPLIYIYQKRITLLHEYISDAEVVKLTNKKSYFNTLLSQTFDVEKITFINQFYKQSFVKKRIAMITKNKSEKMKQFKYLLILPLIFTMLTLSSFGENKSEQTISIGEYFEKSTVTPYDTQEVSPIKQKKETKPKLDILPLKTNLKNKSEKVTIKSIDSISPSKYVAFNEIDQVPIFPGCENSEDQRKCLQDKITQHVNKNFNVKLANGLNLKPGTKRIFVMFKIDKEGNIIETQSRAPHRDLADEAKRVINTLPKMTPGKLKNGEVVGVKYSLPIAFKVEGDETIDSASTIPDNPIFMLNGKAITKSEMEKLVPDNIQSINVLKGEAAIKKYGKKGKNGIIEITI